MAKQGFRLIGIIYRGIIVFRVEEILIYFLIEMWYCILFFTKGNRHND